MRDDSALLELPHVMLPHNSRSQGTLLLYIYESNTGNTVNMNYGLREMLIIN